MMLQMDWSYITSDANGVVVWEILTHLVVKDKDNLFGSGALSFLLEHSPNLVSLVLEKVSLIQVSLIFFSMHSIILNPY